MQSMAGAEYKIKLYCENTTHSHLEGETQYHLGCH